MVGDGVVDWWRGRVGLGGEGEQQTEGSREQAQNLIYIFTFTS